MTESAGSATMEGRDGRLTVRAAAQRRMQMPYAVVVRVNLEGRSIEESERGLHEQVVPMVKQMPGFSRGVWLRSADDTTGMGVVVLDTEANANAMLNGLEERRPPDTPPITSAEVYVVTAEA
jgi:hypothetical protein